MQRAIYFDGWLKDQYCTHPSMPMRSELALSDLKNCKATSLVWAGLGGGSISLPFLHHEAFGPVDPRARLYGYLNDSEFIRRCNENGIRLFSVVFEVQGWEFPAVYGEDGSLQQLNVTSQPTDDWYGLREFSNRSRDNLFPTTFADYYPDDIVNSAGEQVTDLLEECAARDYHDQPIHAQWVEMPDSAQYCWQMCRNNPVWREYLKKIIALQLDAGVAGVQLDESELPITALRHGGCFCRDCDDGFTVYLQQRKSDGKLDARYGDIDLTNFSYKQYILDNGIDFPNGEDVPLFREYWEYQLANVKRYFTELTDYIRSYSTETRGQAALVSGNFFNGMPVYYPIIDAVDIVTTEMETTTFRQPHWYRYIRGFAGHREVIVAENPYGGVVPELVTMLNQGEGHDLYRIFLLEATAYGCNMAMPYGGWMGSTMPDAFHPPKEVSNQVGTFLERNDHLLSQESGANVAVLYSWPSCYWLESTKNSTGAVSGDESSILFFTPTNLDDPTTTRLPFWEAIRHLSDRQVVYDVLTAGDDELVTDAFADSDLSAYQLLILPECTILTDKQKQTLLAFAGTPSKQLLVFGKTAVGDADFLAQLHTLAAAGSVILCDNPASRAAAMELFSTAFDQADGQLERVQVNRPELGIHTHRIEGGLAVHLISYAYDTEQDQSTPEENVILTVPLPSPCTSATLHTLEGDTSLTVHNQDGRCVVTIPQLRVYGIVSLIMEGDPHHGR